jgi:hypothetical protein
MTTDSNAALRLPGRLPVTMLPVTMLIEVITDPDAKPPSSFHAGHCPEPF